MKKIQLIFVVLAVLMTASLVVAESFDSRCGLLDDPDIRAIISSTLEQHLITMCGETKPVPYFPSPYTVKSKPDGKSKDADVQVNNPAGDTTDPYITQSACAIAVRPSDGVLVAGWNDSTHFYGALDPSFCGYAYSDTDGISWVDSGPLSGNPIGIVMGEPDIAVDRDGNFWFSAMLLYNFESDMGLMAVKSTDGGATFTQPVIAHDGSVDDKLLMAIDTTGGTFDGNIYICAVDFDSPDFHLFCTRSTDEGVSFSSAVSICPSCSNDYYEVAPYPYVGPDGTLYVAWFEVKGPNARIMISESVDGGASFQKLPDPVALFGASQNTTASNWCGRPALTGNIRYMDFPSLAVSLDGSIHIAYSQNGGGSDDADVMYVKSDDGGANWITPIKLNDDQTDTDQFMPTIVTSPTGILAAYWYDRREDATNLQYKIYGSRSLEGGDNWSENQVISDTPSAPYSGIDTAGCYMGDYNKAVADENFAYVIWSDNRRISFGHPDPDVYFKAVRLCENENAVLNVQPPGGDYSDDEAPLSVVLSIVDDDPECPEYDDIFYTTNGDSPSEESTKYSIPITISENTTLRVLPFNCCGQKIAEREEKYTFNSNSDDDDDKEKCCGCN